MTFGLGIAAIQLSMPMKSNNKPPTICSQPQNAQNPQGQIFKNVPFTKKYKWKQKHSLDSINLLQFEDWSSFEVPSQVLLLTKENKQIFSSPSFSGGYGKSESSEKCLRCISIMYTRGLNHVSDGSLNEKVCLSFWEAGHKNILQIGEIRAEVRGC